jgi:hypothetical protein
VGRVTCMRKQRNAYKVWQENMKETDHLQDLDRGERMILKFAVKKLIGLLWVGFV